MGSRDHWGPWQRLPTTPPLEKPLVPSSSHLHPHSLLYYLGYTSHSLRTAQAASPKWESRRASEGLWFQKTGVQNSGALTHGTDRCFWNGHCHWLADKMDMEKNQGPDWGLEELYLLGPVRYARPHQAIGLTQSLSHAGRAQLGWL